jgi:hypothetical protein
MRGIRVAVQRSENGSHGEPIGGFESKAATSEGPAGGDAGQVPSV